MPVVQHRAVIGPDTESRTADGGTVHCKVDARIVVPSRLRDEPMLDIVLRKCLTEKRDEFHFSLLLNMLLRKFSFS